MVEDLLRGLVAGPWIGEIDFSTLQKLSAEYVSDELVKRHGDAVWQVRLRERWLYLLVLLEFESRDEPRMALRILTYTSLLYGELIRNGAVGAGEPLPAVLPVVLYNGARAWRAAREVGELVAPVGPGLAPYQPSQRYYVVDERRLGEDDLPSGNLMTAIVQLERSRSLADLARLVEALRERLGDPGEEELRRAFVDWVRQAAERLAPPGAALPAGSDVGGGENDAGRTRRRMAEAVDSGRSRAGACARTGAVAPTGGVAVWRRHGRGVVGGA